LINRDNKDFEEPEDYNEDDMAEGVPVKEHFDFFNNLNEKYSPFSHLVKGKMYQIRDNRRNSRKVELFKYKNIYYRPISYHK
jgi:hypothetical protein